MSRHDGERLVARPVRPYAPRMSCAAEAPEARPLLHVRVSFITARWKAAQRVHSRSGRANPINETITLAVSSRRNRRKLPVLLDRHDRHVLLVDGVAATCSCADRPASTIPATLETLSCSHGMVMVIMTIPGGTA
jgi:hypothetical protein